MALLGKIFGDANARYIKSLQPVVEEINAKESEFRALSSEDLRGASGRFKERLNAGELLDDLLPDAFAAVREAAWRTIRKRHFDVQLIGGIALHQGKIAEMRTGEGKTLVATLPLYLNSLAGNGVHLVTPNDYLSQVGAGWMGPVYHSLGASVGVITHDWSGMYDPDYTDSRPHADERLRHFRPVSRHEAYMADITYGTNNEFGFDYLRDNLEYSPDALRQSRRSGRDSDLASERTHYFAIVDEVDSILIDEARTPLIISMPDQESGELYGVFSKIIPQLKQETDYNVDEKLRAVAMTEEGIDKVEKILNIGNIYEERGVRFVHHLEQALRATALYKRDRDYVVRDGEVIIVDEFTGRLMPGRRWSEGLHQAVEAKEGVTVQQESRTLATVTFQNYFRMYEKLSGMTGTAQTSAEEFHKVYNLDVVTVPTHRPMVRQDLPDLVFRTEKGKFQALAREVKKLHEKGQPVLIGTVSIEKNERLSKMLFVEGVPHELLNAKNHEREALIIAQAGRKGAVTVATNLAGRGVDIILGGSAAADSAFVATSAKGAALADKQQAGSDAVDANEAEEVKAVGGLHVIGTERHEARRIDNQLRGRAGRQGDPGSSQFFVSFEDDLMRIFGSGKIKSMMEAFGIAEDEAIENKMVTRAIESSQAKIEGFHFDTRKHVLEFDDVLNKQRDAIYRMRREILFSVAEKKPPLNPLLAKEGKGEVLQLKSQILEMIREEISRVAEYHTAGADESEWDVKEIFEVVKSIVPITDDIRDELHQVVGQDRDQDKKRGEIIIALTNAVESLYEQRVQKIGEDGMRNIERAVMLQSIDALWMEHLDQMEHLRDSVRLRAYGQRDPLVEYKNEGSRLFRDLQQTIRSQIVSTIFKIGEGAMIREEAPNLSRAQFTGGEELPSGAALAVGTGKPIPPQVSVRDPALSQINASEPSSYATSPRPKEPDRNSACPCGSGKKYKKCHGR